MMSLPRLFCFTSISNQGVIGHLFRIFENKFCCFVVGIFDLVHDVGHIFHLI